eukprot:1585594-Prymnesium_polylepis.1
MAAMLAGVDASKSSAQIDVLVAAAVVAAEQCVSGATLADAWQAGHQAAEGVAGGMTMAEVQNAAKQGMADIPGWALAPHIRAHTHTHTRLPI